jgi:hypothetical protein
MPFRVENPDFIADKLASELLPDQEFREALKNAIEAVERRMRADGATDGGRIEFDVDWFMHARTQGWYLACTDNGDGMNRSELEKYTTTLAVQGAGRNQSIRGNQGMGLKISGPTRHKRGVAIRSLKNGERTSVQIGWDGTSYDLIPIGQNGEVVVRADAASFPSVVMKQGSGTVVTFLGNADGDNTFLPPKRARGWLLKYLNQRFFRPSVNGIKVLVRVPTGDVEDWPRTPDAAAERMRRQGKSFNLTMVDGTATVWDEASNKLGAGWRGVVQLVGNPAAGVPPAAVHWWVLPTEGSDVSTRTASGGSLAVLFQGELYEWRTSNQASPYFARLGVLFGKTRIAFVIEPHGEMITSDFARAHVLVNGVPTLESEAWLDWAAEFRANMPDRIRDVMAEEQARLQAEDPEQEKRIQDRLRDVMRLLRPRRFRRKAQGAARATDEVTGADDGAGPIVEFPQVETETKPPKTRSGRGERARGIGAVLAEIDDLNGQPAVETAMTVNLTTKWVSEHEAENFPIVNGNGSGLRDRAAALAGEDGRTATILLLNRDFRGYQAILAAVNEWANPEGDDDKVKKIEAVTREWVMQKMIEAVQGLRQLENGRTWTTSTYDSALSPMALTVAFMADRYHTLAEVKRAAGMLRTGRRATMAEETAS